jgi:large repetitive protein
LIKITLVTLLLACTVVSWGQPTPVTCNVNAGVPAIDRSDGEAELVGDVVLVCTGGTPTAAGVAVPQINFSAFLNTNITSRLLAPNFSEALILIDEPASANQLMCGASNGICSISGTGNGTGTYSGAAGRPNVFQAQVGGQANGLTWPSLPFDPPGSNTRTIRITNIRADALGFGIGSAPTSTQMAIAITSPIAIVVNNPQVTVASNFRGLLVSSKNVQGGPNGVSQFTLTFSEGFSSAFKTRSNAAFVNANTSPSPVNQNTPGSVNSGSETAFYNSAFPNIAGVGNLGVAGLADNGTRLIASMTNIPAGVTLTAPLTANLVSNGNVTGVIRMINTDSNGVGAFSPGGPTIPVSGGVATLAYEVLQASPFAVESVDVPIAVSYSQGAGSLPSINVLAALAPVNSSTVGDATSPVPRFNAPIQVTVSLPTIVTTSPLVSGETGGNYSQNFVAKGGTPPYSFTVSSGLPPGLSLSSPGNLSGSPITVGTYTFLVTVTDSQGLSSSNQFSLTIIPGPAIATTSPLPLGEVGANYSQTIVGESGTAPYTFSVTAGLLPAGLSLDPTGILSGTPSSAGTSSFIVTVRDYTGASATSQFSLTINPGPTITTASPLPNASAGVAYSQQIAVSGGTTPYRFSISGSVPSGLILDVNGLLSGTPTQSAVGTSSFTVGVTDNLRVQSPTKTFQITVVTSTPVLQASPSSLSFSAVTGGASPPSQAVSVVPVSSSQTSLAFRVVIDAGQSNTPAPSWITVTPSGGNAPAQLVVSVAQGTLAAGTYPARIQIIDANGNASDVGVTLTVTSSPAQLQVTPSSLAFSARAQTPGALVQTLVVGNSGGGSLAFTASVLGGSSWITSLSPNSGQATPNSPVYIQVTVNSQGLNAGNYSDVIQVSSAAGNVNVGISLFVAQSGAILSVNVTGLRLQARQGGGYSNIETVEVLNTGDPTTTINWTADLVSGSTVVSLTPSNGTATATNPGALAITATSAATQATPGGYYALVQISDPNALNSPQYVSAVLDLQSTASVPLPDPSPAGLYFTATSHGSATTGQTVTVNTSSTTLVPFQVAASTTDGASWLVVSLASGNSSGQNPGTFMVSVNPSGLSPGVYTGSANVSMSGALRTVNITAVVLASGTTAHADVTPAQAAGCTPSKVVLTETGLVSNFVVPATWPETLIVRLNDDCGGTVLNGSVVASFSNTDPPLTLNGDGQSGTYSATWQPGQVSSQTLVTLNATAGTLQPATAQLIGGISPNTAPSLAPGGTVNAFYRTSGALAPGTVAEVYGSGLASQTASPSSVPLPLTFDNTFALVGGLQAPLFYLSNGQLDVQIPAELPATQQYVIVVSANNTYTLPQTINVVPVQPGVAAYTDGHILAQHGADYSLVNSGSPAKPGEYLIIYLTAMGATMPAVPSGTAAPSVEPLARVTIQPTVTVGNQAATIGYAGLTPGGVGLYQINFQVPPSASSGDLDVVIMQNGLAANATKLTVAQ